MVAPVPRSAVVGGKIAGGATLGFIQGMIFLLLAPTIGIEPRLTTFLASAGVIALVAFALTGLGFLLAWRMDSTQGFHAVMMVLLLPLWLLSGAFFPAEGAPVWLAIIMRIDPLTYGLAAFRHALALGAEVPPAGLPPFGPSIAVTILFAAVSFAAAVILARRRAAGAGT